MKEIILTITSCLDCPYMETDLNSGDDYCIHSAMGCMIVSDPSVIMSNCPLQEGEGAGDTGIFDTGGFE